MAQQWNADGNYWYDDSKFDAAGNPVKSQFDTWLGTVSGNAPMQTKVRDYLSGLQSNYGLTTNDFDNALKSYGASYSDGGFLNDKNVGWWGEDAMLRAFGTGLDTLNPNAAYKGSWQSLWDQNAENAQQKDFATRFAANEANQGSDLADLGSILKGVGLVAGVGGLAGAFGGGLGLPGADVVGSDWASGLSSAMNPGSAVSTAADAVGNFVPAEAVGGVGSGAGGSDMSWLDDMIETLTGPGDAPYGPGIGDGAFTGGINGEVPFGPGIGDGISMPYGPGINDGAIPNASSLLNTLKNAPVSLLKSAFGLNDADAASLSKLIGTGLGGLLDYKASSGQADALKAIADRSWAAGQPYRDRANAAMTPGFDVRSIPGLSSAMDTATETYLRKLSATNGNPAGIGAAPSQTEAFVLGNVALPAWQNYFNANSNAGGLSSLATQSTGAATNAAGADAAAYGSLGATANKLFNPDTNSSDKIIRSLFGLAG